MPAIAAVGSPDCLGWAVGSDEFVERVDVEVGLELVSFAAMFVIDVSDELESVDVADDIGDVVL